MSKVSHILFILFVVVITHNTYGQKPNEKAIDQLKENSQKVSFRADKSVSFIKMKEGNYKSPVQFIQENRHALGLTNGSLKDLEVKTDNLGMTTSKFQQYHKGVEVHGAIALFHQKGRNLKSMNGRIVSDISLDVQPTISEELALKIALGEVNAKAYRWEVQGQGDAYPKGKLKISSPNYSFDVKDMRLVYVFEIHAVDPHAWLHIEVDAKNGEVINYYSMIHQIETTGTGSTHYNGTVSMSMNEVSANLFNLSIPSKNITTRSIQNNTAPWGNEIEITSTDNSFDEVSLQTGASIHWATEASYDYYLDKFGVSGYNGGLAIRAFADYGTNQANAFWDGYGFYYGDGVSTPNSFSGDLPHVSLDIVGHEYTHAITYYSSGLVYQGESGALNESFSDIFGHNIEVYTNPGGWNWSQGNEVFSAGGSYREMADPNAKRHPDTYEGAHWHTGESDNGGVHTNSGVQNYWYYLITEGGTGTNDKGYQYNVTGIGLDKAAEIAYRNLIVYMTSNSTYTDARTGAEQAAIDLYGNGSSEHLAVIEAWNAVGVPSQTSEVYTVPSIDFGQVYVTYSDSVAIQIRNLGLPDLNVTSITSDNASFDANESSFTVKGDSIYTISVRYQPSGVFVENGTLTITTSSNTLNVALTGEGIDFPIITPSPTVLTHTMATGTTYTQPLVIQNDGLGELNWSATTTTPLSLDVTSGTIASSNNATINVEVTAIGMFAGDYEFDIVLTSDDLANPEMMVLYDLIITGSPVLSTDATVDLSTIYSGAYFSKNVTIENTGYDTLKINDIVSSSNGISITGETAFFILPQASKNITLLVGELSTGGLSETLTINSNAGTQVINIVGTVNTVPITVSADTLEFTILSGSMDSLALTLTSQVGNSQTYDFYTSDTLTTSTRAYEPLQSHIKAFTLFSFDNLSLGSFWRDFNSINSDITVDYSTLAISTITYDMLASSGADVLILGRSVGLTAFDDDEINAITKYVNEGHGVIGYYSSIAGSQDKLAPLWGLNRNVTYSDNITFDRTSVKIEDHELFDDLNFPLATLNSSTVVPNSTWSEANLVGELLAQSNDKNAAVVRNFNRVYYSDLKAFESYNTLYQSFANAIRFAAKSFGTVYTDSSRLTLATTEATDLKVKVATAGLVEGDYQYELSIYDAATGIIVKRIPVKVKVLGVPVLSAPENLTFEDTKVGFQNSSQLTIENKGGKDLVIDTLVSSNHVFHANTTFPITIPAFKSQLVDVVFSPEVSGGYAETMTVVSNDTSSVDFAVNLTANALDVGLINVVEENISITLIEGQSITKSLIIQNSGEANLNWTAVSSLGDVMEEITLPDDGDGVDDGWHGAVYLNNKVYVCNNTSGKFYTYDPNTRNINFEFEVLDNRAGRITTDGTKIYAQVSGYGVYVYNLSGQLVDYFPWASGNKIFISIAYRNSEVWRSQNRENHVSTEIFKTDLDGNQTGNYALDVPARIKGIDWIDNETLVMMQSSGQYSDYSITQYKFDGSVFNVIDSVTSNITGLSQDISYAFPNVWSTDYTGILQRIDYSGHALVNTPSGTIASNSNTEIEYKVSTTGLAPGEYQYHLEITSDDPRYTDPIRVPINLTVISAPVANSAPILDLSDISVLEDEELIIDLNNHISDLESSFSDLQISYQVLSAQSDVITAVSVDDITVQISDASMTLAGTQDVSGVFEIEITAEDPEGLTTTGTMQVTVQEVEDLTPIITFNDIVKNLGAPKFKLEASSNSTGAFTYSLLNDTTSSVIVGDSLILGNAGSVIIRLTQVPDPDYNAGQSEALLTITIIPTITARIVDAVRVYGEPNPTFQIEYSGFSSGEDITVIDTLPEVSVLATAGSPVGLYAVELVGGSDDVYSFHLINGTLEVLPAELSITANNKIITYGDDPNVGNSVTYSGFLNGEDETILTGNLNFGNILNSDAGSYSGVIVPSGFTSANYDIEYVNGNLMITPRNIEITSDILSKTYGEQDPELTYSITTGSLLAGDNIMGTLSRTTGEDAGVYAINPGSLSAGNNYTLIFHSGELSITKAQLTVSVDNLTINQGEELPPFTRSYSGFVNNETEEVIDVLPIVSSPVSNSTVAGDYAIMLEGGEDNNYVLNLSNGLLTINSILGVEYLENKAVIYPNPATNALSIVGIEEIKRLTIYDPNGTHVIDLFDPKESSVQVGDLKPGVYTIQIVSDNQLLLAKFIKQ